MLLFTCKQAPQTLKWSNNVMNICPFLTRFSPLLVWIEFENDLFDWKSKDKITYMNIVYGTLYNILLSSAMWDRLLSVSRLVWTEIDECLSLSSPNTESVVNYKAWSIISMCSKQCLTERSSRSRRRTYCVSCVFSESIPSSLIICFPKYSIHTRIGPD